MDKEKFKKVLEFVEKLNKNSVRDGDYHKGHVVTGDFVEGLYDNMVASGLTFDEWFEKFIKDCNDCSEDCAKCDKPLYPEEGPPCNECTIKPTKENNFCEECTAQKEEAGM